VLKRSKNCADNCFLPTLSDVGKRLSTAAVDPAPPSPSAHRPHIVVGVTSAQTCLVLGGRLRALREAGFRVTLVSSPGELLTTTAAQEGVDAVELPMRREIAPVADILSLLRLLRLLHRLKPEMTEFSTPKAGLLGSIAAMLCRVPTRPHPAGR